VLRPGAITLDQIEKSTELKVVGLEGMDTIRVSGSLEKHYSPIAKVLLGETPLPGQGFIAHKSIETPEGVFRLASPGNDEEFARVLYSALRNADDRKLSEVVVVQPIGLGIAVAIRDRLTRAINGR
jgi:L-threonylcarbamoyladenylate synthase